MGIRPAIALISIDGAVLKPPTIYKAALLCILFITFNRYERGLCCNTIVESHRG